ncbi:MAG: type IV pilus secretin PilQ [Myxococcales bacterium]|jgi:type IV pilus assembly protein PilQ
MKNRLWLAGLVVALALTPGAASAADLNVVKSIDVAGQGGEAKVTLFGSRAPTFTVFKLSEPSRVVVDIAGADVSAVRGPRDGVGPVSGVTVSQFSDEQATVGRLVVALAEGARYDVQAQGDKLVVSVAEDSAAAASSEAMDAEPASQSPAAPGPSEQQAAAPSNDPDIVVSRTDSREVANPGTQVRAVRFASSGRSFSVGLFTDGEVGTFDLIELRDPPRLALDLYGFKRATRAKSAGGSAPVKEVRFGKHADKIRVVIDARGDSMPQYSVERTSKGLRVLMESQALAEAKPAARQRKSKPAAAKATIKDVAFNGDQQRGRIVVSVGKGAEYRVTRPDPRTAILTIENAALPTRLERSLDTSAFGGPVKMVSSFSAPGEAGRVQIVATLEGAADDAVSVEPSGALVWEIKAEGAVASAGSEMLLDGQKIQLVEESAVSSPRAGAFSSEPVQYSSTASARRKYTGRRVSFEFKEIDIHNLLRIIAEVSKRNVIVADNVSGRVTIKLRNVPWDQALDLILKSKGLDKEEIGNIIRIAPMKELEEERKLAAERKKLAEKLEPLKVRLIPVNYATATEISSKVSGLLSERGSITVDTRTNVIIVKDTLEALARAEGLVRRLDTQTPQVLIESRIVEATTTFSRDFGIQWGGNVSFGPTTGNPTGLMFPSIVRVAGAAGNEGTLGTADTPNYAVNMPAPIGAGSGGGVGFIFGSAGGAVALNLRLSAMESAGQIKTISAPKVTTLDNSAASISQGVSIPFSQVSAAGVNTAFVEARLQLDVTPHVTADGSVLLDIVASNNQPDPGNSGANGQPSISKKEAKTQVLVKDGDTTVIGGIYTRSQALSEAAVPVLARIPVLGWLFKHNRETDNRSELLIFITPRIINRNQIVAAGEMTP